MKYIKLIILACFCFAIISCEDDDKKRQDATIKAEKQNDSILKVLGRNWHFNVPPVAPAVQQHLAGWAQWEQFHSELQQKPANSISAYKLKIKTLVERAQGLGTSLPPFFNKPQMKSRVEVLVTKLETLYTYINISVIPDKKVVEIINETTKEIVSLQKQMAEMVEISTIKREQGEEDMIRALDTVRNANPDAIPMPGTPQSSPVMPTPPNRRGIGGHGANYAKPVH